jgi:uncharacterized membrane protein YcaP (DUF421 family)
LEKLWRSAILVSMHSPIFEHMFQLPLPILEKLARPVIVYLVLVGLLRIFGKRELAQLNPFDLVVLLSLSNTVQNAIIGDDNSVTGGVIGAFALLAINWLVARALFKAPRLTSALEGRSAVLVTNGQLDKRAMQRESLTEEELLSVIHKQGFANFRDVKQVVLEPNGNFFIEGREPTAYAIQHNELLAKMEELRGEIAALRAQRG